MVLAVTGSAQAVFTPSYVQRLLAVFTRRLDVILTPSAQRFVPPLAVTVLGANTWADALDDPDARESVAGELAAASRLVLVLPATANTIGRLAGGLGDDLLSGVLAATRAPVLLAPSMNPLMWGNPAVRANLRKCRELGYYVAEPGPGRASADGRRGIGGVSLPASGTPLFSTLRFLLETER